MISSTSVCAPTMLKRITTMRKMEMKHCCRYAALVSFSCYRRVFKCNSTMKKERIQKSALWLCTTSSNVCRFPGSLGTLLTILSSSADVSDAPKSTSRICASAGTLCAGYSTCLWNLDSTDQTKANNADICIIPRVTASNPTLTSSLMMVCPQICTFAISMSSSQAVA